MHNNKKKKNKTGQKLFCDSWLEQYGAKKYSRIGPRKENLLYSISKPIRNGLF